LFRFPSAVFLSGKKSACNRHGATKSSNFNFNFLNPTMEANSSFHLAHPPDCSDAAPPMRQMHPDSERPDGKRLEDAGTGVYNRTSTNRSKSAAAIVESD
jgi:hypothetical protein